ncbi:S-adenosylmethionine uptake transporter [Blastomonas natatoria]|uniref:S-adenosylmethionine uptake transporter n=1 Tax=Blastomonas natatoria TaxID=34015 RepID=A0A2V3UU74_9SPHN|nr:DMT family transporter [Blastomonas natatoria]PXW72906.1 S-adenosylmethionine uptake transporter [Blastomonas natatoria]
MATVPAPLTTSPRAPLLAMLACLGGMMFFGAMDSAMKAVTIDIGVIAALFWRCVIGSVLAGILFVARGNRRLPRGAALRLHLLRGTVVAGMAVLFFWGLARTPMAEAVAITFIAPIIALFLAAVLLKERIGRGAVLASVLGFGGVLVISAGRLGWLGSAAVASDSAPGWQGIAAIMASAVLYAWNLVLQRQQAQIASPQEIVLVQNVIMAFWIGLAMPFAGALPGDSAMAAPLGWGLLTLAAVLAILSLSLLSWAYARAEAQALVPLEYSMFIWGALFGWLIFDETIGWTTLAGAALIVSGCWQVAKRQPA